MGSTLLGKYVKLVTSHTQNDLDSSISEDVSKPVKLAHSRA